MQSSTPGWPEVAKVAFAAVTAVITLYNWQAGRRRGKLKDDLDILKRYREEMAASTEQLRQNPRYDRLLAKIEHRMHKAYVLRGTDQSDLVSAAGFAVLAAFLHLFPKVSPFGLTIPSGWRGGLVAAAAGAALYFFWEAFKGRHTERDAHDTGRNVTAS